MKRPLALSAFILAAGLVAAQAAIPFARFQEAVSFVKPDGYESLAAYTREEAGRRYLVGWGKGTERFLIQYLPESYGALDGREITDDGRIAREDLLKRLDLLDLSLLDG
jgi:hypothetical protein